MTVSNARMTITEVRTTFSAGLLLRLPDSPMPAAIAEFGIPGVAARPLPAELPTTCRTDLAADRRSAPSACGSWEATAAAEDAAGGGPAALRSGRSDRDVHASRSPPGDHVVRSQSGKVTGIDFDRFVLGSDARAARDGARRPRVTHGCRCSASSPVQGAPAPHGEGHERRRHEARGAGRRRAARYPVLARARAEPEHRVAGDHRREDTRRLDAGQRLRQRLAGESGQLELLGDASTGRPNSQVWIAIWISAAAVAAVPGASCSAACGGGDAAAAPCRHRTESTETVVDAEGEIALGNPLVGAGTAAATNGGHPGADRRRTRRRVRRELVGRAARWSRRAGRAARPAAPGRPRVRAPLVFAVSSPLYVAVSQYRHNFEPKYFWPEYFDRVNDLAWLAVLLLGCDARRRDPADAPVARRDARHAGTLDRSGTGKHPVTRS